MRSPMTTLCYIEKEDSYLMLHRVSKKNDVNKDKWIGVGGGMSFKRSKRRDRPYPYFLEISRACYLYTERLRNRVYVPLYSRGIYRRIKGL